MCVRSSKIAIDAGVFLKKIRAYPPREPLVLALQRAERLHDLYVAASHESEKVITTEGSLLMCELSVKKVIDLAIELYDSDANRAISFLYKPSIFLDGKSPISLLDTSAGVAKVVEHITRLQYGMIS